MYHSFCRALTRIALTVAPDSGARTEQNTSKHFSLTYSKLDQAYLVNVLQFQDFTLQLLERIIDPKVSPYKNFPTGLT